MAASAPGFDGTHNAHQDPFEAVLKQGHRWWRDVSFSSGLHRKPPQAAWQQIFGPVSTWASIGEIHYIQQRVTEGLRQLEYGRRLLQARLDLAVASVLGLDDTSTNSHGPWDGLGEWDEVQQLLRLESEAERLDETSVLDQLRASLRSLDERINVVQEYQEHLHQQLGRRLDAEAAAYAEQARRQSVTR